ASRCARPPTPRKVRLLRAMAQTSAAYVPASISMTSPSCAAAMAAQGLAYVFPGPTVRVAAGEALGARSTPNATSGAAPRTLMSSVRRAGERRRERRRVELLQHRLDRALARRIALRLQRDGRQGAVVDCADRRRRRARRETRHGVHRRRDADRRVE